MAPLGLFAVWLLLVCQSDCSSIHAPKVNDILHNLPDIDVHEIVREARDDVKDMNVQKALRTATKDAEQAIKELENNVEDINVHKMMKKASSDEIDVAKAVKKIENNVEDIDVQKVVDEASSEVQDLGDKVKGVVNEVKDTLDGIISDRKIEVHATSYKCYGVQPVCGFSITLAIDGVVYINQTLSAHNPPPICFDIPKLKNLVSACIKFYNVDLSKKNLHGCVQLELELVHMRVIHQDLGCFNIPLTLKNESIF